MNATTQFQNKRYLCNRLVHNGVSVGLSLVTVYGGKAAVEEFVRETHSTVHVGEIRLTTDRDNTVLKLEIN